MQRVSLSSWTPPRSLFSHWTHLMTFISRERNMYKLLKSLKTLVSSLAFHAGKTQNKIEHSFKNESFFQFWRKKKSVTSGTRVFAPVTASFWAQAMESFVTCSIASMFVVGDDIVPRYRAKVPRSIDTQNCRRNSTMNGSPLPFRTNSLTNLIDSGFDKSVLSRACITPQKPLMFICWTSWLDLPSGFRCTIRVRWRNNLKNNGFNSSSVVAWRVPNAGKGEEKNKKKKNEAQTTVSRFVRLRHRSRSTTLYSCFQLPSWIFTINECGL